MIKELIQHDTADNGFFDFTALVIYRKKTYAIAFKCYPDYQKDHIRLYPDNLRFLQKDAKPTELCISKIKTAIRQYKKFY